MAAYQKRCVCLHHGGPNPENEVNNQPPRDIEAILRANGIGLQEVDAATHNPLYPACRYPCVLVASGQRLSLRLRIPETLKSVIRVFSKQTKEDQKCLSICVYLDGIRVGKRCLRVEDTRNGMWDVLIHSDFNVYEGNRWYELPSLKVAELADVLGDDTTPAITSRGIRKIGTVEVVIKGGVHPGQTNYPWREHDTLRINKRIGREHCENYKQRLVLALEEMKPGIRYKGNACGRIPIFKKSWRLSVCDHAAKKDVPDTQRQRRSTESQTGTDGEKSPTVHTLNLDTTSAKLLLSENENSGPEHAGSAEDHNNESSEDEGPEDGEPQDKKSEDEVSESAEVFGIENVESEAEGSPNSSKTAVAETNTNRSSSSFEVFPGSKPDSRNDRRSALCQCCVSCRCRQHLNCSDDDLEQLECEANTARLGLRDGTAWDAWFSALERILALRQMSRDADDALHNARKRRHDNGGSEEAENGDFPCNFQNEAGRVSSSSPHGSIVEEQDEPGRRRRSKCHKI